MCWTKYFLPMFAVFALLFFSLPGQNQVLAQDSRMATLETAVSTALEILLDSELTTPDKKEVRRQKLRDVLYPQFNFTRMAQGSVGRKWRKFSVEQKERFTVLFTKLLENTYLGMIERYQGEKVTFVKEVQQSKTVVRIDSIIVAKGQKHDMSYRLGKIGEQWKVFDIIIEGVSVIANYRAQFNQLLRKRKPDIDGMLAKLEKKVAKAN